MEDLDSIPTFTVTTPENTPPLTQEELESAKKELIFPPYPIFNKKFIDDFIPKHDPQYALFSYVPRHNSPEMLFLQQIRQTLSKEHQTTLDDLIMNNKQHVYGVGKIRGAFSSLKEAEEASDKIIKNIDSTHSVYICKIGVPFPLVTKGFANEVKKIDLRQPIEQSMVESIRQKRAKEQREIEAIKQREQQLTQPVEESPYLSELDNYIQLRVGLAHTRYEHDRVKSLSVDLAKKEKALVPKLLEIEKNNPTFVDEYMDRYMQGRKNVGLSIDGKLEAYLECINKPIV